MRFVWAVVAFVLATVLIGVGIAQRTVFLGPSEQQQALPVKDAQPYILIDGDVLRANSGLQTLMIRGEGEIFAAYGRDADMTAWLSDATYERITLDDQGAPVSSVVEPTVESQTDAGRDPAGSDLWLDFFADENALITETQLPEGMSMLVARDGVQPAPADLMVTWPIDTRTPWAGPLIVAGAVLLLVGLVLYILGIRHQRRGRGPLRKGPGPLPPTEPIDLSIDAVPPRDAIEQAPKDAADEASGDDAAPEASDATTSSGRSESRARTHRRVALTLPALVLSAVVATGCSSELWPSVEATATPEPTQTVVAPENQKPPAVTEAQATRILKQISTTLATADEGLDIDLAATRLSGAALEARRTDYTLRKGVPDRAATAAPVSDQVEVLLPEATDTWPRRVLMITKTGDEKVPPTVFTMVQADPWSNYRIEDISEMQAAVEMPRLAAPYLGTTLVPPDSTFLSLPPKDLASAFSSLVDEGEKSTYNEIFDDASRKLAGSIGESRQAVVKSLADKGASETSKAAFDMTPATDDPTSMATLDSGAIVAVSVNDVQTITPTNSDAVIRFGDNAEVKLLAGASEAAKGVRATYSFQLFFAVPSQGSTEQIRLLGAHQDILSAEVIK